MSGCEAHFAAPGDPPGRLRDLLAARVAAVPAGGAIDWVTYYFRDRRLGADLLRARGRGVRVQVALDGHPRSARANDALIGLLAGPDGLGAGLRVVASAADRLPVGRLWRPRLHEKLYCFSHPEPVALVGSFNPSGDDPEEDPDVLREIQDHDRGWNALVEIREPAVVTGLIKHARRVHGGAHGPFARFGAAQNRALRGPALGVYFWPRLLPHPVAARLRRLSRGSRVRVAASHLSGATAVRVFGALGRRGVRIEMLTGDTERRVPSGVAARLAGAGVTIARIRHPLGLPMHDKFLLAEAGAERWLAFGSFNWSEQSYRLNREIGIISPDPALYDAFAARWESLRAAI